MKLRIDRPYVEAIVEAFPARHALADQLRLGDRVEVAFDQLGAEELAFLGDLYRSAGPHMQGQAAQLATLQQALNDEGVRFGPDELETLVPALARYLCVGGLRGWLFQANVTGRPLPYVVTRLDYTAASNDEAGKVYIELKANAKGTVVSQTVRVSASDIAGKTVGELLAGKGFLRETVDLIDTYDGTATRYFDWRARYGAQFSCRGMGFYAEDPNASHRNTDWTRKDVVVLSSSGGAARMVNDEGILATRSTSLDAPGDILASYLAKASKSNRYDAEDEVKAIHAAMLPGLFTSMPVHAYVLMFHLDLHHYVWVHVDDMAPYAYQPALKQKLILPPEQTDLIDILTAEMDVLMDDVVAGKSGGTTVLCAGPAGVGKTLTAEVYSEIIQRPLYRVHSGQLGLNVGAMETALKDVLTRAQRWGAVMLIDEADVYIKRREDDMAMNAVVGVFLRVLEYFNGLLFLTTNRVDDIDEAIISRCIAVIRFHPPDAYARRKIWQVMTEQFALDLSEELIDTLADRFPQATGRDIKGLSKLVAKYCSHRQCAADLAVFDRCAIFRAMSPGNTFLPMH